MEQKTAMKILKECGALIDTLPSERFTAWDFLVEANAIISKHKGVDCLMHVNFVNGNVMQCMCIATDWEPGAIVFQSDDGEVPMARIVYPEEYEDFMNEIKPIITADYPKMPEETDEE